MDERPPRRGLPGRVAVPALVAADAVVMVALVHRGLDRLLLGMAGALPLDLAIWQAALSLLAAAVLTIVMTGLGTRGVTLPTHERWWEGTAVLGVLVVVTVLASERVLPLPAPLQNLTWLWHGLASDLDVSMHVSPEIAKAGLVAWLSLAWALTLDGRVARAWVRVVLGLWALAAVGLAFGEDGASGARGLAALAGIVPLAALALAESRRAHAAARLTLAAATLSLVAVHASALVPLSTRGEAGMPRVIGRIGSTSAGEPRIEVAGLAVSADGRFAAAALDEDEGLARIDLASGAVAGLGLGVPFEGVALDPQTGVVAAWAPERSELLSFRLEPLTVRRSVLVPGRRIGSIGALAVRPGRVLLANRPGAEIDEYAIDSMSFVTEHRLTPGDSTIASYVTTHVAADAATGSTFATLINADDADDRRLARLEPGRGRTASMVPVVGADALALVDRGAGASLVLVGNARTGTVEMLDAVTLQSVRTLKAPIDVRALVWEPRRSVVLAMGRLSRQVSAIDLRLGRVVKSARLDAVPRAIALDPKRDRLLVGDAHGLGAIDLASWLYPAPIAFAP